MQKAIELFLVLLKRKITLSPIPGLNYFPSYHQKIFLVTISKNLFLSITVSLSQRRYVTKQCKWLNKKNISEIKNIFIYCFRRTEDSKLY